MKAKFKDIKVGGLFKYHNCLFMKTSPLGEREWDSITIINKCEDEASVGRPTRWNPELEVELVKEIKYYICDLLPGDIVEVMDPGLLALQKFAPKGARPNNIGIIQEVMDDGDLLIAFPIGDAPMSEHSQVAPYPPSMIQKRSYIKI